MKTKTISIIITCVIILASAAYLAGQLLNQQSSFSITHITGLNGTAMTELDVEMLPAPELPVLPEIARGVFIERTDNIITIDKFIGNALGEEQRFMIAIDEEGSINIGSDGETKQTEVIITPSTKLYHDKIDPNTVINTEDKTIQQVVEEGTLDDFNKTTFLTIWGRDNGDRIIADVIFYSSPDIVFEE